MFEKCGVFVGVTSIFFSIWNLNVFYDSAQKKRSQLDLSKFCEITCLYVHGEISLSVVPQSKRHSVYITTSYIFGM